MFACGKTNKSADRRRNNRQGKLDPTKHLALAAGVLNSRPRETDGCSDSSADQSIPAPRTALPNLQPLDRGTGDTDSILLSPS